MPRIRSVKPDFFQSETIAALPLSARLLFIGMWTHADDNGVMLDNTKLINAAVWPLEDDPLDTLQRTHEDLRRLSSAHLIARYVTGNRRLIFITGWDEHQKVSHPGKERYPRPTEEQLKAATSANADSPEGLGSSSGDSREDLVKPPEILGPEQGAGSREQGYIPSPAPRARARGPQPGSDEDPDWCKFWAAYPKKVSKADARKRWAAAVKKTDPAVIIAGAERYAALVATEKRSKSHIKDPDGWLHGEKWTDELATTATAEPSGAWWDN